MTVLENTFEGGTNSIAVSAANSGGASGNAFDAVFVGSNASLKYDDAEMAHGLLSARVDTGASAVSAYMQWDQASLGDNGEFYERWYFRLAALPASTRYIREWRNSTSGTTICRMQVTSAGNLRMEDSALANIFNAGINITDDVWYRIEVHVVVSTGQAEMKIFTVIDSATPADTQSSAPGFTFGAATCNRSRAGWLSSAANLPHLWVDDWAFSTVGWIGPAVTVKLDTDVATSDEVPSVTVAGTTDKSDADTATGVDLAVGVTQAGVRPPIRFGSTAWYQAEQMTDDESFTRFLGEFAIPIDYIRAHSSGIPKTVARSSGLTIANANGVDCQLGIKTDWESDDASLEDSQTDLVLLLTDLQAVAPMMRVAFVLNFEPENSTEDPSTDAGLAAAIVQSFRWGEHCVALARTIWAFGNPNYTVHLGVMGYNSRTRVSNGLRLSPWLSPSYWNPGFSADERANVVLCGDIFPRLDENGDISSNLSDDDQRLTAQAKVFSEYAALGYTRFGFGEFSYNCDLCLLSQEAKVRDAWRGYDSVAATVAGSIGEYLATPPYPMEFFSNFERSYASTPGGPGAYAYLHLSSTRMDGFRQLVQDKRVVLPATEDTAGASDVATVEVSGINEVSVDDTVLIDDSAVPSDA